MSFNGKGKSRRLPHIVRKFMFILSKWSPLGESVSLTHVYKRCHCQTQIRTSNLRKLIDLFGRATDRDYYDML